MMRRKENTHEVFIVVGLVVVLRVHLAIGVAVVEVDHFGRDRRRVRVSRRIVSEEPAITV